MMQEFVPIYKDRDFYVPAFEIKIGGHDLDKEVIRDVINVRYSDSIDQIDSFELTVNNWDAEERDFKYIGSKTGRADPRSELFDPGQEVELWMGYFTSKGDGEQPLQLMLVGIITSLTPTFPQSGGSTLKVLGQNILRELLTKQETHFYENNLTDSDIARKIDQRGNLKIRNLKIPIEINRQESHQEVKNEHVLQNNQYDILFLLQRARLNGYDVLLKYRDEQNRKKPFVYFGTSAQRTRGRHMLEWGKSLIQFQPTLTTTRQVSKLTVRGWDAMRKTQIKVTVTRKDLKFRSLRDRRKLERIEQGFHKREEIIVDKPFRTKQEARRYALDRLERITKDFVTGKGSTIGTPDLRAGTKISLAGLGPTFSGTYFVKSTTHTIGLNGYTTDFDARLEEDNP
jgi:phage protein D